MILLVGVPGAGKTNLGKYLASNTRVRFEPSGEHKRQILKELGIEKKISCMGQEESTLINALYFEQLNRRIEEWHPGANDDWHYHPLLVDTHATYYVNGNFVQLLPQTLTNIEGMILLYADAKTIVDRRISRGRDKDSVFLGIVTSELYMENRTATIFANSRNIPFIEIDNTRFWKYDLACEFVNKLILS